MSFHMDPDFSEVQFSGGGGPIFLLDIASCVEVKNQTWGELITQKVHFLDLKKLPAE